MATKETITSALNKIEFVYKMAGIPIFGTIVNNFKKGYKPAKDFVKNLANKIEDGKFKDNIEVMNYLTNLHPNEIVPHSYSKYPKSN